VRLGEQVVEDMLEIGGPLPLTWSVSRSSDEVLVRLHNPRMESVEAELTIIGPPETWTRAESGAYSMLATSPRRQAVRLEPGADGETRFVLRPAPGVTAEIAQSLWLVVRLGYNHHVEYRLASALAAPPLTFAGGELGCLDLRPFLNNDAISAQSNLWDGAFSGDWDSIPAEELPPSEQMLTVDGQPFFFPSKADGALNNIACEGQSIPLVAGAGAESGGPWSRLLLLGAAQHDEESEVEITYADGSRERLALRLSSIYGTAVFGEKMAVQTTHLHTPWGDKPKTTCLYVQELPLDPLKQPSYVTLPDNDDIHIFAMTLRP